MKSTSNENSFFLRTHDWPTTAFARKSASDADKIQSFLAAFVVSKNKGRTARPGT
jgi:hypothetical protein